MQPSQTLKRKMLGVGYIVAAHTPEDLGSDPHIEAKHGAFTNSSLVLEEWRQAHPYRKIPPLKRTQGPVYHNLHVK